MDRDSPPGVVVGVAIGVAVGGTGVGGGVTVDGRDVVVGLGGAAVGVGWQAPASSAISSMNIRFFFIGFILLQKGYVRYAFTNGLYGSSILCVNSSRVHSARGRDLIPSPEFSTLSENNDFSCKV
jgi:hypothetical protein